MGEMIDLGSAPIGGELVALQLEFFEEAADNIDAAETLLLATSGPAMLDEQIGALFRAVHSIKGGAATFEFADVVELAHAMESLLDGLRRRAWPWRPQIADALLRALDGLRDLLTAHRGGGGPVTDVSARLAELNMLAGDGAPTCAPKGERILRLTLGPISDVDAVDGVVGLFRDIDALGRIEPIDDSALLLAGYRSFKVVTSSSESELADLFSFYLHADQVTFAPWSKTPAGKPGLGKRIHADASDRRADQAVQPAARAIDAPTLRVAVEKLDQLDALVSELARVHSLLAQQTQSLERPRESLLVANVSELDRIARDLRRGMTAIRMTSMAVVFRRFPRVMHDLGERLGKLLHLQTEGDAVEVDRFLVDKLVDPLTHLVRNSADHGIESPVQRVAAGKSAHGTIRLTATHQDGRILVEVTDDGAGLSRKRILDKARCRGLPVCDEMTDQEVWSLVWEPGFSTAEELSDVSGRGVGMDVVKSNIADLGGSVALHSVEGQGTRVSILLPSSRA